MKNLPFHRRLRFSLNGIASAWKHEASFRTQCGAAFLLCAVLAVLRPPAVWCALLLMQCGTVLGAELFNTALEHTLDRLHPEIHPAIKVAKDCAAGAVLLFSFSSLVTFALFLVSEYRK